MRVKPSILIWCLVTLLAVAISTLGVSMTTTDSSAAKPVFKLKAINDYFEDGRTQSLVSAAMTGDIVTAKRLVAAGANPNDEGPRSNDYNRIRPLHYAIAANNQTAVKTLMAVGADPELSVQGFGRAFLFALTLRNIEMLTLLLDLRPINKLSKKTVEYLLFEATTDDCRPCLELLLKRGVPVDTADDAGYTAMMRAIDAYDYELAEWLMLKGASVHIEVESGTTPAYSIQYDLQKYKPGSPPYRKALHLKELMQARGAVFPAQTPAQVRAKRTNP